MTDVVAAASLAFGRELRDLGGLGGSPRSGVHRASDGETTVVVKSYAEGSRASWARERVGLAAAGAVGSAPRLLASAAEPPLVVMEDLGTTSDVAQLLLGADPQAADEALVAWGTALGTLHARTHADRAALASSYAAALAEVDAGTEEGSTIGVVGGLEGTTADWAANAAELGLTGAPDVTAIAGPLTDDDHHALSPADACPDNNLLLDDGCRLIDFEWSEVRHPAWDAAYLAVPWPTCWCSWQIPDDSAARAMDAYRVAAEVGIPHVASDVFESEVEVARVSWALISTGWSLRPALREVGERHPASPDVRPRVQHRLAIVADSRTSAAAAAGQALEITREQWGSLVLPLAPAYR